MTAVSRIVERYDPQAGSIIGSAVDLGDVAKSIAGPLHIYTISIILDYRSEIYLCCEELIGLLKRNETCDTSTTSSSVTLLKYQYSNISFSE